MQRINGAFDLKIDITRPVTEDRRNGIGIYELSANLGQLSEEIRGGLS